MADEGKAGTRKDYAEDVRLNSSRFIRYLLIALGSVSLVLGTLGVFLPVLPTTPFLLLSAACYARGSVAFYNWLMNNRYCGSYIRSWRHEKRIPRKVKILAVLMIALTIGSSVAFFIDFVPAKVVMALTGILVIAYIARIPTA